MSKYLGKKTKGMIIARKLRENGRKCSYCEIPLSKRLATIDHIIPRALGGKFRPESNMAVACLQCNIDKKDRMGFPDKKCDDNFKAVLKKAQGMAARRESACTKRG